MGRDHSGYNYSYEAARETGIQPVGAFRKEYDGPISYGGGADDSQAAAPGPPGAPQPAGYFAAPAYAYPPGVPNATPYARPVMMPGIAPMPTGVVAPAGSWYTSQPAAPANVLAAFTPLGAKPAGVKTTSGDDRPPAVMISPVIASDKATVNTHLQVRWDLRTPATPEHLDGNGAIPDLTQPATNPPTRAMYIVAEELPWAISIKRYNVITCQDVLDAIYKALREPIKRDEFFAANPKKRHQITKISLREAEDPDSGRPQVWNESKNISRPADPLRIDWLGTLTDFRGLYIDVKVLNERCTWQIDDLQDAWVLDLGLDSDD